MKKHYPAILAVLIAFCIAFVGCGGSGDAAAPQDDAQEQSQGSKFDKDEKQEEPQDLDAIFAGEWEVVAMESSDPEDSVSEDDIQAMKDMGLNVILTLAEDGTAKLVMFDEDYGSGTWEAKSETEVALTMEGDKIDVVYDPATGRLSLEDDDEAIIFVRSTGSSSSANSSGSKTASDYDAIDDKGNLTFYSILELDGSEIATALELTGYEWEDDNKWWVSEDGNDAFYVSSNDDYEYLYDEIGALKANGAGKSCVFVSVVDDRDYSTLSAAFKALCNIEIVDEEWLGEDSLGIAIVKSPSGNANFVIMDYNTDAELYVLSIFNEEAISSGLLDEYLGDDYGHTIEELQSNLF